MRPTPCLLLLTGLLVLSGRLAASDFANPPLYITHEKVELTVGKDISVVTGSYRFEFAEKEDPKHQTSYYIHFPLYVDKSLTDWHDIAAAAGLKFQVGNQQFTPCAGNVVAADFLAGFPVPDDAAVAFLSFEIPGDMGRRGFEATLTYTQPNVHYHGTLLAVYTAWLPKLVESHALFALSDQNFSVHFGAAQGVTLRRFLTEGKFSQESPTDLVATPEHRKTLAVEIVSGSVH